MGSPIKAVGRLNSIIDPAEAQRKLAKKLEEMQNNIIIPIKSYEGLWKFNYYSVLNNTFHFYQTVSPNLGRDCTLTLELARKVTHRWANNPLWKAINE